MGNLSCVSCKVKNKKTQQKSIGELALGDFKGASFNQEVVKPGAHPAGDREADGTSKDNVRFSEEDQMPNQASGNELYNILKSQRIQVEEEEEQEDIEKAARAIVDMTVFLTTQVIYPAYLRYLKEDHPDMYTQIFERPRSPLPGDVR